MHHAALIGGEIEDAHHFGWSVAGDSKPVRLKHNWEKLVESVQANVKSSNFGYRTLLRTEKVNYINAYGTFVDSHTVQVTHKDGKKSKLTAKHFIVATGERPRYPCEF